MGLGKAQGAGTGWVERGAAAEATVVFTEFTGNIQKKTQ